jgi:hypothetical protein
MHAQLTLAIEQQHEVVAVTIEPLQHLNKESCAWPPNGRCAQHTTTMAL